METAFHLESCASETITAAVVETKGKRDNHEDAHSMAVEKSWGNFWLLDGHRGSEAATFGATALAKEIGTGVKNKRLPSTRSIQQGFRTVDNCLRKHLSSQESKSGSTVVGALVAQTDDGSYTAKLVNCGDSRGVVIKDPNEETIDKDYVLETVDHKPNSPTERKRIKAAGGEVRGGRCPRVDGRLAVSRSIGDFEFKADRGRKANEQKVSCDPDVYEVECLRAGSILLLACDGVWDVMSTDEVAGLVREQLKEDGNIGSVAAQLIQESLDRGSTDNLSVLIVHLSGSAQSQAKSVETSETMMSQGPHRGCATC